MILVYCGGEGCTSPGVIIVVMEILALQTKKSKHTIFFFTSLLAFSNGLPGCGEPIPLEKESYADVVFDCHVAVFHPDFHTIAAFALAERENAGVYVGVLGFELLFYFGKSVVAQSKSVVVVFDLVTVNIALGKSGLVGEIDGFHNSNFLCPFGWFEK